MHLVAKRLGQVDRAEARELMLYVQARSWRDGLPAPAAELLAGLVPLGTPAMQELGMEAGRIYTAAEVRRVRAELSESTADKFTLRGECNLRETLDISQHEDPTLREFYEPNPRRVAENKGLSAARPESFSAGAFVDPCRLAARCELAGFLAAWCLDPAQQPDAGPWYFARFREALRANCAAWQQRTRGTRAITANGQRIRETLEYMAGAPLLSNAARPMGLVFGGSGYGKSFEAETAGAERPGRFRHVKTPIGNDDHSFFLAINKALGGLQNTRAKALELRERREAALEAGDVVLVLDDAHRLWIQTNLRDNTPKRVEWVLQMADRGVPIILIACPQFFDSQGLAEDKVKWNTLQFDRRIGVAPQLHPPTGEDPRAVAASLLPGVSTDAIRALATVAGQSPGPLGTVDTIARRALHLASDAGAVGAAHVREAIKYAMATNAALAQAISHRRSKAGRRQESGQLGEASEVPAPAASPARGGTASHDLAGDCPAPVQLETTPRQTLPPAAPAPVSTG